MSKLETLHRTIAIPEQVIVQLEGRKVFVKGPFGSLQENLSHLPITLSVTNKEIEVSTSWPRKREIGMLGTAAAQIRNMMKGVTEGYKYSLRSVYAHFPVTVKVDEKAKVVRIENFTGEKTPRFALILDGVQATVKGEDVFVEGTDLKAVSQTAANIQNATRIRKKDQRVFLDGIYVFQKSGMVEGAKS